MMRTESEMLELIINTAQSDDRIRAVLLNGSRANPNTLSDLFQDFDIVYLVTDTTPFYHDFNWIKRFGEIMILQLPDDMQDPPPSPSEGFAYLMQFIDGNRIGLSIVPIEKLSERLQDSLTKVLLDKDNLIPSLVAPNENNYLPQPPTTKQFADCCNEFWWMCSYVAKGLWRGQVTYAKYMVDPVLRDELMKMLCWYVGVQTQFSKNPGSFGKYIQKHLEPELWDMLMKTYADASVENTWDALDMMCRLFRKVAIRVAEHFSFAYPEADDHRVSGYLKYMRMLPKNSTEIYP
jgi:aminoglycoside 6-adenylyltransferase